MIDPSLLDEVRPLAEQFASAQHRLYLVGGIVRDQVLGRHLDDSSDIDLTTDARPPEIKRLVRPLASAVWTQGERFGTIGCRIGARSYEITTHRGEVYVPDSRKPAVTYSDTIEYDLARRDFTINAMAAELPSGAIIDPYDGARDLAAHTLRTPLSPEVSFGDDPLRMLRAARFLASHTLTADRALIAAVDAMASRLAIVSAERRRDELDKLLAVDDPRTGLAFLGNHGLATYVVPDLVELGAAARAVLFDAVAALPTDRTLRLAALLEPAGARADERLRALRYPTHEIRNVVCVIDGVQLIQQHEGPWSAADVRRLARQTRTQLDNAVRVAATLGDVGDLSAALGAVRANEDLDALDPGLDGVAVMRLLGVPAGPAVGEALAFLTDLRLTEGSLDRAQLERRLRDWWNARR